MGTRAKRMLALLDKLDEPRYESTKTTTREEQSKLLEESFKLLEAPDIDKASRIYQWLETCQDEERDKSVSFTTLKSLNDDSYELEPIVSKHNKKKEEKTTESQDMGYNIISHCSQDLHNTDNFGLFEMANDVSEAEHIYKTSTSNDSYNTSRSIENPFMPSPSEYFPSECDDTEELEIEEINKDIKKLQKAKKRLAQVKQHNGNKKYDTEAMHKKKKSINLQQEKLGVVSENKSKQEREEESQTKETDVTAGPSDSVLNENNSKYDLGSSGVVKITEARKNNLNKIIRDKKYCCLYCHKFVCQIAKHLEKMHSKEIEVSKILALPKNSKERRDAFSNILKVGNYYHNCEVLTIKEGDLILVRRPSSAEATAFTYNDYGPCPDCLGFMLKKHLWHHVKYGCKKSTTNKPNVFRRNFVSESSALIAHTLGNNYSSEFFKEIIDKLRTDDISLLCKQDLLIMKFAYMQFEKYHNTQSELIRQSARQLGRLLLELRNRDQKKKNLDEWLFPENFDTIIESIKKICYFQEDNTNRPTFNIPSLALKLGYSIKKCVNVLKGMSLRKGDIPTYDKLNRFLEIMDMEWAIKISANALATFETRKINTVELLPLTEDLVTLNNYLNDEIKKYNVLLKLSCNYQNWKRLATVVLAKLILFNKRRSGEAAKMLLEQYNNKPDWTQVGTEEFKNSMSAVEIELANKLGIVQITGKRGRTVNIILSKDVTQSIDLLIEKRQVVQISAKNDYVFARGSGSINYIRGHDAIRKCAKEVTLKKPELMNGTKFRKYIGTVCQVFNLTENETDWLARHLGHDIRVHRDFYRLHESTVELTKVSRILLAIESGEAHKFKGMKLSEINLTDLPDLPEENETDNLSECNEDEMVEVESTSKVTLDKKNKVETSKKGRPEKIRRPGKKGKPTNTERLKWSIDEKKVVLKFFKTEIRNKTVPGKTRCEECKEKHEVLARRSWQDIKYCIYNYLKTIK